MALREANPAPLYQNIKLCSGPVGHIGCYKSLMALLDIHRDYKDTGTDTDTSYKRIQVYLKISSVPMHDKAIFVSHPAPAENYETQPPASIG